MDKEGGSPRTGLANRLQGSRAALGPQPPPTHNMGWRGPHIGAAVATRALDAADAHCHKGPHSASCVTNSPVQQDDVYSRLVEPGHMIMPYCKGHWEREDARDSGKARSWRVGLLPRFPRCNVPK